MSYWVKWDASPNRQVIHQILDEYEEGLLNKKKKMKVKKERRKRVVESESESKCDSGELGSVEVNSGVEDDDHVEVVESGEFYEKGAVRKLVSFIGERIWGVWGV